jgi:hypothetical protein
MFLTRQHFFILVSLFCDFSICYDIKAYTEDVARDTSYTSAPLGMHTDYVFTNSPPAVSDNFI